MKQIKWFTTALLIVGVLAGASAQTVDEVVSKYTAAVGGDKWNAVNAITTESTMSSGNGMETALTTIVVRDKAYKWEMNAGMFQMTRCIVGDEGWSTNPRNGGAVEAMTADQVKSQKDLQEIPTPLFDYKAKGHTAELVGKEDMDGTEVFKIKLTKKMGGVEYYFLDAKTFLILKRSAVQNMMGREVQMDILYSNYKDYEGLKIAYSMETKRPAGSGGQGGGQGGRGGGGFGGSMTVDKIKLNPKIKDNEFKMPK